MRTESTLGVIFFTRKKRNNPERLDIYARITVNKERAEFSIKRDIAVCNRDFLRCRAKETGENLILFNSYLDDVYAEVLNAHKQLHSERKLIAMNMTIIVSYYWPHRIYRTVKILINISLISYCSLVKRTINGTCSIF